MGERIPLKQPAPHREALGRAAGCVHAEQLSVSRPRRPEQEETGFIGES